MHIIKSTTAFAVLCILFSFLSKPGDTKIWLTSADDVLQFSVPPEWRRGGNAFSLLMFIGVLVFLWLAYSEPQATSLFLYKLVPLGIFDICLVLHLLSLSKFTINVKTQTYDLTSRWLWLTSVHRGPMNDFRAVYISDRNDVGLVYRHPGMRIKRLVPLGSAGFGGDGKWLAQEVGRMTGLEVVTKL